MPFWERYQAMDDAKPLDDCEKFCFEDAIHIAGAGEPCNSSMETITSIRALPDS